LKKLKVHLRKTYDVGMRRTNVVKLVVDEETHEKLKELGI